MEKKMNNISTFRMCWENENEHAENPLESVSQSLSARAFRPSDLQRSGTMSFDQINF